MNNRAIIALALNLKELSADKKNEYKVGEVVFVIFFSKEILFNLFYILLLGQNIFKTVNCLLFNKNYHIFLYHMGR